MATPGSRAEEKRFAVARIHLAHASALHGISTRARVLCVINSIRLYIFSEGSMCLAKSMLRFAEP